MNIYKVKVTFEQRESNDTKYFVNLDNAQKYLSKYLDEVYNVEYGYMSSEDDQYITLTEFWKEKFSRAWLKCYRNYDHEVCLELFKTEDEVANV